VATWLTGHPLLVPEVAYPFWILLGAAIGRACGASVGGDVRFDRRARLRDTVVVVALLGSIPFRARADIRTLNLSEASSGFYFPERSETALPFRWTSRRAAFFVAPATRVVPLSIRAIHIAPNLVPTVVSIGVDGAEVKSVSLANNDWTQIQLALPTDKSSEQFRRIDLITSPVWSPSVILNARGDMRVLGVEVSAPEPPRVRSVNTN